MKLITIGDKAVGKTCLTIRYFDNRFSETNLITMGVAQLFKTITVLNKTVKLQLFDTAG